MTKPYDLSEPFAQVEADLDHRRGETLADVFDRCRIPKDVRRVILDEIGLPAGAYFGLAVEMGLTVEDLLDEDPETVA